MSGVTLDILTQIATKMLAAAIDGLNDNTFFQTLFFVGTGPDGRLFIQPLNINEMTASEETKQALSRAVRRALAASPNIDAVISLIDSYKWDVPPDVGVDFEAFAAMGHAEREQYAERKDCLQVVIDLRGTRRMLTQLYEQKGGRYVPVGDIDISPADTVIAGTLAEFFPSPNPN